MQEYICRS